MIPFLLANGMLTTQWRKKMQLERRTSKNKFDDGLPMQRKLPDLMNYATKVQKYRLQQKKQLK